MELDLLNHRIEKEIVKLKSTAMVKRPFLSKEDQLILDDILDKTVFGLKEVLNRVNQNPLLQDDESTDKVFDKCVEVLVHTYKQLDGLKEINTQEKVNEELNRAYDDIKNFANDIKDSVSDYFNSPETKTKIYNAKKQTLDLAEKGLDKLREILKLDE